MADKRQPVDIEGTILVRLKPAMMVLVLIVWAGVICLTALAGWTMLFDPTPDRQGWIAAVFGVVLILVALILAQMSVGLGWLIATSSQPVLVITPAGLIDRRLSPKLVPWTAITRISEARSTQGMPALVGAYIEIERTVLNALPAPWPRSLLPLRNARITTISAVATDIDPRTLHATLSAFWKAHKDHKEPINV